MKRRAATILLFLFLGATTTVVTAWGCSSSATTGSAGDALSRLDMGELEAQATSHGMLPLSVGMAVSSVAQVVTIDGRAMDSTAANPSGAMQLVIAGWPMHCCSAERVAWMPSRTANVASTAVHGGIDMKSTPLIFANDAEVVPLRPIWPGFAINTVFYAFILWMLFAVPFTLRRRRRLKRGLCVRCAYDQRGHSTTSNVCPECGATQVRIPVE